MTKKDIEAMLSESEGLDMSHIKKEDILAKAKQEIYFGSETASESQPEKKKSSLPFFMKKRFIAAAAGIALALTLCIGSVNLYNEDFQTLYIDINPSVALKLNRFERVVGVEFLNEEAKTLLSNEKLVGCNAEEALEAVITACDTAGYVKQSGEIYISASAKEEKASEKLLVKLKVCAEKMDLEGEETYAINTYNAKKEEKENIKKSEISPAKYKLIHDIIEEEDDYHIEDLKGKTMNELKDLHNKLHDDDDNDDDDRDERPDKPNMEENDDNRDDCDDCDDDGDDDFHDDHDKGAGRNPK